jgi:hypothetical protein
MVVRGGNVHTYDGLWIVGPRGAEAELAKLVFCLLREGVQSGFGALGELLAWIGAQRGNRALTILASL